MIRSFEIIELKLYLAKKAQKFAPLKTKSLLILTSTA